MIMTFTEQVKEKYTSLEYIIYGKYASNFSKQKGGKSYAKYNLSKAKISRAEPTIFGSSNNYFWQIVFRSKIDS